jgi:hypothetical protein
MATNEEKENDVNETFQTPNSSNVPNDFPTWEPLDEDRLKGIQIDFLEPLFFYMENINIDSAQIDWDAERLYAIFDMVHKRKVYMHIYHEIDMMSELNESCLYVFWILKLRPFRDEKRPNYDVNFFMALEIFTLMVNRCAKAHNIDIDSVIYPETFKQLLHAFKFQDMSKESLMLLAKAMVTRT